MIFARTLLFLVVVSPAAIALSVAQREAVMAIARRNALKQDQILFRWQRDQSYEGLLGEGTFTKKLQDRFLAMKDRITFGPGLYMSQAPFAGAGVYGNRVLEIVIPRGTPYLDFADGAIHEELKALGIHQKQVEAEDLPIHTRVSPNEGEIFVLKRADNVRFRKFTGEGQAPLVLAQQLTEHPTQKLLISGARDYLLACLLTDRDPALVEALSKLYGNVALKLSYEKGFESVERAEDVLKTYSQLERKFGPEHPILRRIATEKYFDLTTASPEQQLSELAKASLLSDGHRSYFNESFLRRAKSPDEFLDRLRVISQSTLLTPDNRESLYRFIVGEHGKVSSLIGGVPREKIGAAAPQLQEHILAQAARGVDDSSIIQELRMRALPYLSNPQRKLFSEQISASQRAAEQRFKKYLEVDPEKITRSEIADTAKYLGLAKTKAEALQFLKLQGRIANRHLRVVQFLDEIRSTNATFRELNFNVNDYRQLRHDFVSSTQWSETHPYSLVADPANPYQPANPAERVLQEDYAKLHPEHLNYVSLIKINRQLLHAKSPVRTARLLDSLLLLQTKNQLDPNLVKASFADLTLPDLPPLFAQWKTSSDDANVEALKTLIVHAVAGPDPSRNAREMEAMSRRTTDKGRAEFLEVASYLSKSDDIEINHSLIANPYYLRALDDHLPTKTHAAHFLQRYPFLAPAVRASPADIADPLLQALEQATTREEVHRYTDALLAVPTLVKSDVACAVAAEKLDNPSLLEDSTRLESIVRRILNLDGLRLSNFPIDRPDIAKNGSTENRVARAHFRSNIRNLFASYSVKPEDSHFRPLILFSGFHSGNPNKEEIYKLFESLASDITTHFKKTEVLNTLFNSEDLEWIKLKALSESNDKVFSFLCSHSGKDPSAEAFRYFKPETDPVQAKTITQVIKNNPDRSQPGEFLGEVFIIAMQNNSLAYDDLLAATYRPQGKEVAHFPEGTFTDDVAKYLNNLGQRVHPLYMITLLRRLDFGPPQLKLVKFLVDTIQSENDSSNRGSIQRHLKGYIDESLARDFPQRSELITEYLRLLESSDPTIQSEVRRHALEQKLFVDTARPVNSQPTKFLEQEHDHRISRPTLQGSRGATAFLRCKIWIKNFLGLRR